MSSSARGPAVFDMAAINARRRQLFGAAEEATIPAGIIDRERHGTATRHCGICPKAADEACHLQCDAVRAAIKDGVTVR
jgi:hypothetical protein